MGKWAHEVARGLVSRGDTVVLWFEEDFPQLQRFGPLGILIGPIIVAWRLVKFRKSFDVAVVHEPLGFWYALARRFRPSLPAIVCMSHSVENRIFRLMRNAARLGFASMALRTRMTYWVNRGWQSAGFLKFADRVICLSSVDRIYIAEQLGRDPLEVTFTVNGVDLASLPAPESKTVQSILFVGGWLDIKGKRLVPPIWNFVAERFPDARLTLVGTGVDGEKITPSFDARFVDRVCVIPRVTNPAGMRQQYEEHEILLMPSLSEGSSLSLLEAMAHGLTIVASTGGGNPDLIEDGVTGLLFDPFDLEQACAQLSRALSEPDEARVLGMNAARAAGNFSWAASVARLRPALLAAAASPSHD